MAVSLGLQLIASLLESNDIIKARQVQVEQLKSTEIKVYEYIEKFLINYGVFPTKETISENTGIVLPTAKEPFAYYEEQVNNRFLTKIISEVMVKVQSNLSIGDVGAGVQTLVSAITDLAFTQKKGDLIDFRYVTDMIAKDYKNKLLFNISGVKSGWPYLDEMMGGLEGGDVLSICGRPAMGKTFLLLKMAFNAWLDQSRIPLVVSPEMKPIKLAQRLAAMYTHKPLTNLTTASFSTKVYDKFLTELRFAEKEDKPFYIIDGSAVPTIEDLYLICRQLTPDAVYYDGAYLMKHKNKGLNKWDRIGETANGLKNVSTDLNLPVVASYQFNRDAAKKSKKKDPDIGLEDIYGADDIGQLSSVVLGMLQDESIKTLKAREVTLLKGRNGENGMFEINWNFHYMDFSEILEVDPNAKEKDQQMASYKKMNI